MRRLLGPLLLVAGVAACVEKATAPGVCPDFCPGGTIAIQDTVMTDVIVRDSAFRGYRQPYQAELMAVADSPGVIDSRAIFRMNFIATTAVPTVGDTVPIVADSSRLEVVIVRHDPRATSLFLKIYRLPLTIDSSSTFSALAPSFSGPAADSANVTDLLTRTAIQDSASKANFGTDSIRTDSAGHTLQITASGTDTLFKVYFDLDTLQAPFVVADSGKIAWGVRVHADSLASISVGTNLVIDRDPQMKWFYHYTIHDTTGVTPDSVVYANVSKGTTFHSFVFDPPNPAFDDNLTVGGAPSARSVLRVAFPQLLRDSVDIVRATLVLLPVVPAQGLPGDSFRVVAVPVLTDFGAKSPASSNTAVYGSATVPVGSTDTVRVELSDLMRGWAADTSLVTTLLLTHSQEGSSYTEIQFHSSRDVPFKPVLHVTYVKRFQFGAP